MGKLLGSIFVTAALAGGLLLAYRIAAGIDGWFTASGAGNWIGWGFTLCLLLSFLAMPVGAFGLAARAWVVRLDEHQRLESTARVLQMAVRPPAQLTTVAPARQLEAAPLAIVEHQS